MPIPRQLWNLASGYIKGKINPARRGILINYPAIFRNRSGFIDSDVNFHMNNASYCTQMELALWHAIGYGGILDILVRNRWVFLIGSQAVRYRHGLVPFKPFEIHTQNLYWDDQWIYLVAHFVCPTTGKIHAEGLTRVMLRGKGEQIEPRRLHLEMGVDVPMQPIPDTVRDFLQWDKSTEASMKLAGDKTVPKSSPFLTGSMNNFFATDNTELVKFQLPKRERNHGINEKNHDMDMNGLVGK